MAMFVVKSIHIQINGQVMDLYIAQRSYSVCTALLAFAHRASRRSAFLKRYGNAVRTPLWCDRGLTGYIMKLHILKTKYIDHVDGLSLPGTVT